MNRLPPTIFIDGYEYSTTDSAERPLGATVTDIINFYKWFGESEIVDHLLRPITMWHGTDASFTVFDNVHLGENTDYNASTPSLKFTARLGHWFNEKKVPGCSRYKPRYIKMERPYRVPGLEELAGEIESLVTDEYGDEIGDALVHLQFWMEDLFAKHDGIIVEEDDEFGDMSVIVPSNEYMKTCFFRQAK